jgi:hypothetical protein
MSMLGFARRDQMDADSRRQQVVSHVEDSRSWYDRNAKRTMKNYHRLRGVALFATTLVPIFALVGSSIWLRVTAACLGGIATLATGYEGIHQFREHYITWRYTAEQLEREKYEFIVKIGPYAVAPEDDAVSLLAQRAEAITSQENQQWLQAQEKADATATVKGDH